jgi:adenylate cyclase
MGQDVELAVVFADVVGSTHIYEVMGDQRARAMVATCIDIMRAATEQHGGTVIKTMGDEVMSTFVTADDALNAAAQMQRDIRLTDGNGSLQVRGQPVALRIGCHFGPVVLENRDVFGATVHTANRLTSQAKGGQIVTTATTCEHLSADWRAAVRQIDIALLKGQGVEIGLYEALWQTEDVTSMVPASYSPGQQGRGRVRLFLAERDLLLDATRPHMSIGRADENDIVIRGTLVSRVHSRIEIRRNKIMLIDQSTNGTFVHMADVEEAFVRRDTLQLRGSGLIGLGRVPEFDSVQTIRFACEAEPD